LNRKIIRSERLGEQYTFIKHTSGLDMLLHPMPGFTGAYALFTTKYGSIDTCFKTNLDGGFVEVPEGIAHFLEHKLFEGEDGEDAFTRYALTGASANAYTSFDRTAYLFSCTDNFAESLEILLDFVTHPYFSEATVLKEQGIIGQEINMTQDNPEWCVFFNLLKALYHNNPARIDIAGTIESIAKIDADLLYRCYNTFYNLNNMSLVIAGNFTVDEAVAVADKVLKPAEPITIERHIPEEPYDVKMPKIEAAAAVAQPLFQIGFKADPADTEAVGVQNQMLDEMLLEIIAGEASPLYRRMYDSGLINSTFSAEVVSGRGFAALVFAGESRDPERVKSEIIAEIESIRKTGLDAELFAKCKKAAYGNSVASFGRVESVASLLLQSHLAGLEVFDILDFMANMTLNQVQLRLPLIDPNRCAISVVRQQAERP